MSDRRKGNEGRMALYDTYMWHRRLMRAAYREPGPTPKTWAEIEWKDERRKDRLDYWRSRA